MAVEEALTSVSFPANTDLSASQYCFVDLNSSGNLTLAGAGPDAFGVLQNKPSALGYAGTVGIAGRTKIKLGATLAVGAYITSDSTGRAVEVGSGEQYLGLLVQGGDVNQIGAMILDKSANPA